jgi:hypothetical protein
LLLKLKRIPKRLPQLQLLLLARTKNDFMWIQLI